MGEFPACLLLHRTYSGKGVSFSLWQDSTRKTLPPQNKEAEPQPTSLLLLTSQNIPLVTVRLGRSSKLTTRHWSKIHKSPPRRQDKTKREIERAGTDSVTAETGQASTGLTFTAVESREPASLLAVGRQSIGAEEVTREDLTVGGGDLSGSGKGSVGVKRDLTSNIKVSRCRVASPSAVDCHTLVLALVRLLTVFNLKCSWGGRPKCHSSGLHHTHPNNTHTERMVDLSDSDTQALVLYTLSCPYPCQNEPKFDPVIFLSILVRKAVRIHVSFMFSIKRTI